MSTGSVHEVRKNLTSENKCLHQGKGESPSALHFAVGEPRSFFRVWISVPSSRNVRNLNRQPGRTLSSVVPYSGSGCLPPDGSGQDLEGRARCSFLVLRHPCFREKSCRDYA